MEDWLCTELHGAFREVLSLVETNVEAWTQPIILSTIEAQPPKTDTN